MSCGVHANCTIIVITEDLLSCECLNPGIVTAGSLYPNLNVMMLPFTERKTFRQILTQVCRECKPVILHAPFQTGKTSFLLALGVELIKHGWDVVRVEMSVLARFIEANGNTADVFFSRMSELVFGTSLARGAFDVELKAKRQLCLLVDEFQAIYSLPCFEKVKIFFYELPTDKIPYVAVGTFKSTSWTGLMSPRAKQFLPLTVPHFTISRCSSLKRWEN